MNPVSLGSSSITHVPRLGVVLLLLFVGCSDPGEPTTASPVDAGSPPNILLYVVDTLRADTLGCYGHDRIDTPNVDRLAAEGLLFENAYAPTTWTRPSVASILTSLRPGAHGTQTREHVLPENALLLSEWLRDRGYTTGFVTTNPNVGRVFGFDQGFDEFVELYARREPGVVRPKELITPSDEVTERVHAWIDAAGRPFFLVVLTIDPHSPYTPPASFDRYGGDYDGTVDGTPPSINRRDLTGADKQRIRSLYEGEVAFNDRSFGSMLRHLQDVGLDENTLVVFTSDHGEEFWEHAGRGHGKTLYEETTRVPLILRYPAVVQPDTVQRAVTILDVFPTVLQLAGVEAPAGLQGRSLLGDELEPRTLHFRLEHDGERLVAALAAPWKVIWDLESGRQSLFDLAGDPGETRDVAAANPEPLERLSRLIAKRMADDAALLAALVGDEPPRTVEELPPDVLRALEALGYVD